jgi:hemoglobin
MYEALQQPPKSSELEVAEIQTFQACGTSPFMGATDNIRLAPKRIDIIFPEVPFPSNILLKGWGEQNIRDMVHHHHSLLRKSSIGHLFAEEEEAFAFATKKTADFFVETLGGEKVYTSVHGHPALRERHMPFTVDEKGRDIWLMMYKKTMKEVGMPLEYTQEFWEWIEALSIRMINRRTTTEAVRRYPYEAISAELQKASEQ